MKIAIYAISKNEQAFMERCIESARDADYFVLADTGSTDQTAELARRAGALVYPVTISPWRFDHARNAALALVPAEADVCVSLDVDEVMEPGWRDEVERLWTDGVTRIRYLFDWSNGVQFASEKIHARSGYYWKFPCHENLVPDVRTVEQMAVTDKLLVRHLPDPTKSRGQYLDLLRVGAHEFPSDPRTAFYYGRELFFRAAWQDAIRELSRYLELPSALWKDERSSVMGLIAKSFRALSDKNQAGGWFRRAVAEAPHRREAWVDLSAFAHDVEAWDECLSAAEHALSITEGRQTWLVDPQAWGSKPYDLAAVASYRLGKYREALAYGEQAANLSPGDERLQANLVWYRKGAG